jgi:ABC-type transporter Mla MlaB component
MWKVRRVKAGDRTVLSLSGRLESEHLSYLREVLESEAASQKLVLDLKDLRLVDQNAVTFLAHCEACGASLRNCPAYIRNWIGTDKAE